MNTEATTELEELTEQQRGTVQLSQSERFTMQGHLRKKLAMGRKRLAKTWGQDGEEGEVDDEVQILARDIDLSEKHVHLPTPTATPEPPKLIEKPVEVTPPPAAPASRWPMAAALALGLGIPGTAGVLMAPTIIDSLQGNPPVVNVPAQPGSPDYAPILLPGKPPGAK